MSNQEFALLLYDNLTPYLLLFPFITGLYLLTLRKYYSCIIDPMFLCVLTSGIAFIAPIYLYSIKRLETNQLYYCIFSELMFWIGFVITYKRSYYKHGIIKNVDYLSKQVFRLFFLICVLSKIIIYVKLGIPILLINTQMLYANAGGLAMLGKLSSIMAFYCLVYSFHMFNKNKLKSICVFLFFSLTAVLDGSKGFVLSFVFSYFAYKTFFQETKARLPKYFYVIIAVSPILILLLNTTSNNIEVAFANFLFRIVAFGDIYWFALPENDINYINIENPFSHLFTGILGPLRLIDYNQSGVSLGNLLFWRVNDISYYGETAGPNARPVILGYWLFGYWGILFCYISGCLMAFFTTHIKKYFTKSILSASFVGYIYLSSTSFATDPVLTIFSIIPVCICLCLAWYLMLYFSWGNIVVISKNNSGICNNTAKIPIFNILIIAVFLIVLISIVEII